MGTQLSEALGTAMATIRQTEPLPWLWTAYNVPCLCPAREGAGLPQPGRLLTWHRVYLGYSVLLHGNSATCHWGSLSVPPERLDSGD